VSALAHYIVSARRVDSDGVSVRSTAEAWTVYCTLDEIGCRTVAKSVRERFHAEEVRVQISCGVFVAEVLS
jgi:hypothetical protein